MDCLSAPAGVSCIGLDRRSGAIVESTAGGEGPVGVDELHPVLADRLVLPGVAADAGTHAPVRAVNAMLRGREGPVDPGTLADLTVATTALDEAGTPVVLCASCRVLLGPVVDTRTVDPSDGADSSSSGDGTPGWIRENVETALRVLGSSAPIELGFDRRSVEWVEGFLERARSTPDFDATDLTPVLGSLLGQCLIEEYRGHWVETGSGWAVRLPHVAGPGSTDAFPFTKVDKQARNGLAGGESIVSFFDLVALAPARPAPPSSPNPYRPSQRLPTEEVHGEVQMDVRTFRAMVRATLGWRCWLFRAIATMVVVYALLILVVTGNIVGAVAAMLVALAFGGHEEVTTRINYRYLRGLTDQPWRYRFDAIGIGINTPATQVELLWSGIRRVTPGPSTWLVVTTTRGRVAIPRAAFTAGDAERIDRDLPRPSPRAPDTRARRDDGSATAS